MNIICTLVLIGTSVLLQLPAVNKFFDAFKPLKRNIIYGIIYGLLTCAVIFISTSPLLGNSGNMSYLVDASPIIAGLLFDLPAGIIAGGIGAVFRIISVFWAGDSLLRIAGAFGVLLCGCLATLIKRIFFNEDYKPNFVHCLFFTVIIEICSFTLIFLSNLNNLYAVFRVMEDILLPCIGYMTLCVTLSILFVNIIRKEPVALKPPLLIRSFEKYMLFTIGLAAVLMLFFSVYISGQIAIESYSMQLSSKIEDIQQESENLINQELMDRVYHIEDEIQFENEDFNALAEKYNVSDINIIEDNINVKSNHPENIGYDMLSSKQSSNFMKNVMKDGHFVQKYMPMGQYSTVNKKYAGVKLSDNKVLQIGYDTNQFQKAVQEYVYMSAKYCHIGNEGEILVYNAEGRIIASRTGKEGKPGYLYKEMMLNRISAQEIHQNTFDKVDYTWMYNRSNDFCFVAMIPTSEILFSQDLTSTLTFFICIILFSVVFGMIYLLLKKLVIQKLDEVNTGLNEVTNGNLDAIIDVRSTKEFIVLSDDINQMISSLKGYIHDAETRYEKDLNNARIIQNSALPSYQQFCKNCLNVQLYASMNPAQDVGGDFYDFYPISENEFVFCIADVSGKGIPAAMFMMRAKALLRSTMEKYNDLSIAFEETNNTICESNDAGLFVTVWMGVCNTKNGTLNFVNAGHNPPLLYRYDGEYEQLKTRPNLFVGGRRRIKYNVHTIDFRPGDRLFLYTDGVTEANNIDQELFGDDRLLAALNQNMQKESDSRPSIEDNCAEVLASLNDFVGTAEQFDDITMLGINCIYLEDGDRASFSGTKESTLFAQRYIDKCNRNHRIPLVTASHILICSDEIVSNSVKYGHASTINICYKVDNNAVILEIQDDGVLYNPLNSPKPDISLSIDKRPVGGLGLFIVERVSSSVEYSEIDGMNNLRLVFEYDPDMPEEQTGSIQGKTV